MNMHPAQQVPAVYHRRLGDLVITTVSDGYVDLSLEPIRGVSREEAERMMLKSVRRLTPRIAVNSFVVRSSSNVVLIDAGSGTTMGPTCGRLMENLAAAEIKPEDIDTILLTHIHPDHSNGLTDDNGH